MSTRAGKTLIHQLPTVALGGHYRFIASQGDTAPKLAHVQEPLRHGFIASQGDTAPKLVRVQLGVRKRFITSQDDTAPKQRLR